MAAILKVVDACCDNLYDGYSGLSPTEHHDIVVQIRPDLATEIPAINLCFICLQNAYLFAKDNVDKMYRYGGRWEADGEN